MIGAVESSTSPSVFEGGEDAPVVLEALFRHIAATRMAGVGLLNPALQVEAVGFRRWEDEWLGVLVTPWFMSLICLPGPGVVWESQSTGSKRTRELPSGSYEFLTAIEEGVGPYLTSSLFSPMSEFQTMDQAREVAAAVLVEVFTPAAPPAQPAAPQSLTEKLQQPVSRRGFLGALLRPGAAE